MSLEVYRTMHVVGLALLMVSAGISLATPKDAPQKTGMIFHGTGLIVLFVAGFGLLSRLGLSAPHDWPVWLWIKLGIWLVAAVLPVLVRKGKIGKPVGLVIALCMVGTAAWLGISKST